MAIKAASFFVVWGILLIKKIKDKFPKGGFARSVTTIMTGTALAQLISVITTPVITRIYSPENFGLYALYASITALIAVFAAARYEFSIMLPKEDEDAINIMALSFIIVSAVSFICLLLVCFFGSAFASLIGNPNIKRWLYFVPLTALLAGLYQPLTYWTNRKKQFKTLASSRVIQASTISGIALIIGFSKFKENGLLTSYIIGQGIATLFLGIQFHRKNKKHYRLITIRNIYKQAKRYIKFPKYDVPSSFLNTLTSQIPVFLFNKFFDTATAGFYSLTNKVLRIPISLISGSISDVFNQRASDDYAKLGNCKRIYIKTLKSLFLISFPPFFILFLFAPWLFSLVFGQTWRVAGEYAQIMSAMFFLGFVASPLTALFLVAEKQNYNLVNQAFLLIISITAISAGIYLHNIKVAIIWFTVACSIVYIISILMSYNFSKGCKEKKEHE